MYRAYIFEQNGNFNEVMEDRIFKRVYDAALHLLKTDINVTSIKFFNDSKGFWEFTGACFVTQTVTSEIRDIFLRRPNTPKLSFIGTTFIDNVQAR